jgi:hypothetical protein
MSKSRAKATISARTRVYPMRMRGMKKDMLTKQLPNDIVLTTVGLLELSRVGDQANSALITLTLLT